MHKFFKGLARAFRCQAQPSSSTRNSSAAAAQQDGIDDSPGGCYSVPPGPRDWHIEKAYLSNTHLLRAWRVNQDGGSGVVESVGARRPPTSCDQAQGIWLSLPPIRMRRIESIKDLAVTELRTYLTSAAAAADDSGSSNGGVRACPLFSARRWFFAAAHRWLTEQSQPAVSAGRFVLPPSSSVSAAPPRHGGSAASPARLILASDVRQSNYAQTHGETAVHSRAVTRSAVGAAALQSSVADERPRSTVPSASTTAGGRLQASATLPEEWTGRQPPPASAADSPAGLVAPGAIYGEKTESKDRRVKAELSLDAAVRQLLELIEIGQDGSARSRQQRSKESLAAAWPQGVSQEKRAPAASPVQPSVSGMRIGESGQTLAPVAAATASINPAASFNLGLCYEHGWGVPMNKDQAAELYRHASELGHMASCYNLAQLYLSGAVTDSRAGHSAPDEARQLMEQAAAGNLVEAQTWLGAVSFEEGNYGTAFKMFEKAAKQNCALAQYYLGVCYENGFGVSANMEAAAIQYKEAAAFGIADAQYNLGVFYQEGLGGLPRDLALARDMFAQANLSNHAPADRLQMASRQRNSCSSSSSSDSSSSERFVQNGGRRSAGHLPALSIQVGKSASLPSFSWRLGEMSAARERSSIRGRCSGPPTAGLPTGGGRGHGIVDYNSTALQSGTSPSTDDSAIGRSSGEPLFYIGDESDLGDSGDGTSGDDDLAEWSDDSGQLSPGGDLLSADAFGESLSNPYFGSSLMG